MLSNLNGDIFTNICNVAPYYIELSAFKNFIFRSNKTNSIVMTYEELTDIGRAIKFINQNYNNQRYTGENR